MAFPRSTGAVRWLAVLGSLVLVVACLYWARKILIPLVLAVLLAFILTPLVTLLQNRGLRRPYAAFLVVLLAVSVVIGIGWSVTREVEALAAEIPEHKDSIGRKIAVLRDAGQEVVGALMQMTRELRQDLAKSDTEPAASDALPVRVEPDDVSLLALLSLVMGSVAKVLANAGLVLVLALFMLIMREDLRNRVYRLIGDGRITHTTRAVDDAAQRITRYLFSLSALNVLGGLLVGAGLHLIGVPYALLWGVLFAILRFIPYLGSWLGMLLPVAYGVAIFPGWFEPLATLVLIAALEISFANVVEPWVFGHSTGLSPLAVLLAAVFWTWLWGPIGLLLSTPLTTCLVVLAKYVPSLGFLDVLLGDRQPLQPHLVFYQRLLARDQDEAADLAEDYLDSHSPRELCENVLLPALSFAKAAQVGGDLTRDDRRFLARAIREILNDQLPAADAADPDQAPHRQVLLLSYAAREELDDLALELFHKLLAAEGVGCELLSKELLVSEMVARIREADAALVCLGSLAPAGLTATRQLCKRLRAQVPGVHLLVARWGNRESTDQVRARLRDAGANQVSFSLHESRAQIRSQLSMPVVGGSPREEHLEVVNR